LNLAIITKRLHNPAIIEQAERAVLSAFIAKAWPHSTHQRSPLPKQGELMLKIEITIAKSQIKLERRMAKFQALLLALVLALTFVSRSQADTGNCSGQTLTLPFTDVMGSSFFCSITQLYFQGITLGTTATTYSPSNNVTRDQMAAFLSRTQNSALHRGSRRAALNQFWTTTPQYDVMEGAGNLGVLRKCVLTRFWSPVMG
jgi:hypothetical protein